MLQEETKQQPFLYAATNTYSSMPIHNWYFQKFGKIANRFNSGGKVNLDDFLKKYENKILLKDSYYDRDNDKNYIYCGIVELDSKGTIGFFEECYYDKKQKYHKGVLSVFYTEETPILTQIQKYCVKKRIKEEKKGIINLVSKTPNGFELKEYIIKNPEIDFNINYNEDFKEIDSLIINKLNVEDAKGLVLLYGNPGTGKTSYIRRIINCVDKRVLYMPPDMASELSNPGLIPFLTDIPNSILIVEDSENVLIKRQGQHNQAISNILNLSDGLLSDCLNIQIVATFNTDLKNIDEALLRKGRLIAKYEFKELTQDRVKRLSKKLGIKFEKDSGTLAEVYNFADTDFTKGNKKPLGFSVIEG